MLPDPDSSPFAPLVAHVRRAAGRVALLAALLALGLPVGCASAPKKAEPLPPAEVVQNLQQAEQVLAEGDHGDALEILRRANVTPGLSSETRGRVQEQLERTCLQYIEALSDPARPKKLRRFLKMDLPRPLAVRAGLTAARLHYEAGQRSRAFETIEEVDLLYPNHSQRREAGRILGDVGFSFAEDSGRYWLFFRYRALAPPVLTYLVDNYPSEPRTDDAYATLGKLYEEDKRWLDAIESHEDLILWRPDSPLASTSQARIPHLRLRALSSPEYDRNALGRARRELESWLDGHAEHPLRPEVERDLTDAIQRLADSDLSIARFYRKVGNPEGAEFHARRALDEARSAGNEEQADEVLALLVDLGEMETETPSDASAMDVNDVQGADSIDLGNGN